MIGDEATKWFLRHHFRNHGLTALRYFLKRGFMETLVKAYSICFPMVAQGHRHQLSIPPHLLGQKKFFKPHLVQPLGERLSVTWVCNLAQLVGGMLNCFLFYVEFGGNSNFIY